MVTPHVLDCQCVIRHLSDHGRAYLPGGIGAVLAYWQVSVNTAPSPLTELGVVAVATLKSFFDSKSDEQLGSYMRDRYERLHDAYDMGIEGAEHPGTGWNAQNKVLRDHKISKDAAGSGLGSRELEENDKPNGDDPGEFPGKPSNPQRNGGSLAGDLALEESRIRQSGCADVEGALHLARIRRSDPAAVRALSKLIPAYDRILPQNRDKRVVDDDGIVQPPRS